MPLPSVIEVARALATCFTVISRRCYSTCHVAWPGLSAGSIGPDWENALGHPSRTFLFHLEPDKGTTLQAQLRRMLVSAILDGQIPPGGPLPSCRSLAQSLKIARNTVVLAYQDLVEEGFLIARERSGFFANPDILGGRVRAADVRDQAGETKPSVMRAAPNWQDRFRLASQRAKEYCQAGQLAGLPLPLHLRPGRPGPVPAGGVARMLAPGAQRHRGARLVQGPLRRRRSAADRADPHPPAAAPRRAGGGGRDPGDGRRAERALPDRQPAVRPRHRLRHREPRLYRCAQHRRPACRARGRHRRRRPGHGAELGVRHLRLRLCDAEPSVPDHRDHVAGAPARAAGARGLVRRRADRGRLRERAGAPGLARSRR